MATIHQFDNNPEEDEFYLVEIYWFITYTLVEPSINQQFINVFFIPPNDYLLLSQTAAF